MKAMISVLLCLLMIGIVSATQVCHDECHGLNITFYNASGVPIGSQCNNLVSVCDDVTGVPEFSSVTMALAVLGGGAFFVALRRNK